MSDPDPSETPREPPRMSRRAAEAHEQLLTAMDAEETRDRLAHEVVAEMREFAEYYALPLAERVVASDVSEFLLELERNNYSM